MPSFSSPRNGAHASAAAIASIACLVVLGAAASAPARTTPGSAGKLDSRVQQLVAGQQRNANLQAAGGDTGLTVDSAERVLVDVYVDGDAAHASSVLAQAGMDVQAATNKAPVHMVEGWLPVGAAPGVVTLDLVRAVVPVTASGSNASTAGDAPSRLADGGTNVGSVTSQGDVRHNGPQARALDPSGRLDGRGVTVGVISDSISRVGGGLDDSVSSSDVPDLVRVLKEGPTDGKDEGRAMMEIIHDTTFGLAEGDYFFASGTTSGPAGKADSINQLTFHGVDVVADDIFYLGEPFFQDGVVAQAVDNAKAHGVAYFTSAGNRARQSWEGTFTPSTAEPRFNDFNPFAGEDTRQIVVSVPNGRFIVPVLQWDEPWGGATTDIDMFLLNDANGATLGSDRTDNRITGIPSASVFWRNTTGASVNVVMRIERFAGTRSPFMKYIANGDFGTFTIAEHGTASHTIDPDAASANGALTVAAVPHFLAELDDPESFSSRGPAFRLFDRNGVRFASPQVRQKPNLAGADGVSTSVPNFNPFFGTSAAAPSAAAVGALVKSARPSMSVGELTLIMQNPANGIDCRTAGRPDADCGNGFILADRAVRQALVPSVTSVSPANGATSVFTNANVVATFDLAMDKPATQGAFSLRRTSTGAPVAGSFVWFGNSLVFDPGSRLQEGVQYTATVSTAARSALGFAPGSPRTWTFTTTNRPVVESVSPAHGATGASRNTQVIVQFSKAMNKPATQAAFSLRTSGGALVAGSFTWFGNALVFQPSTPLAASTSYAGAVSSGARDASGNTLLNPTLWSFRTGT